MLRVADVVSQSADQWRDQLSVTIGRASQLSQLPIAQIRYFESLGALLPSKTTDEEGASRLYTLTDLRRLAALAQLRDAGYRPAEAAELLKQYGHLIDCGRQRPLADLIAQEGNAITDGFLLSRVISQIAEAFQAELIERFDRPYDSDEPLLLAEPSLNPSVRVTGVFLPMRQLPMKELSQVAVQQWGSELSRNSARVLVAVRLEHSDSYAPGSQPAAGRNDRMVLFYSHKSHQIPEQPGQLFCLYTPPGLPERAILLRLETNSAMALPFAVPWAIDPESLPPARRYLLDRMLTFVEQIAGDFQQAALMKQYRYRSDGFEIKPGKASLTKVLGAIRQVMFPGDTQSLAAILIPNSLDAPTSLSVFAHYGYEAAHIQQIKLDLREAGQGLCGRAYKLREPFLSRDARHDPLSAYRSEEQSQIAMAVPLVTSWGIASFGVLYLASRTSGQKIPSEQAFAILLLGSILSELLGRWWLNRLRREQEGLLHQRMHALVHWFDGIDADSPDLQKGLHLLQSIWERVDRSLRQAHDDGSSVDLDESIALIVFDIDSYRTRVQQRSNDLFPLRAQQHVAEAVRRVRGSTPMYWFKNDHVLLILEGCLPYEAKMQARRIARQVETLPFRLSHNDDIEISVTFAMKGMTYQELYDLDGGNGTQLEGRLRAIIEHLRDRAGSLDPAARQNPRGGEPEPLMVYSLGEK